MIKKNLTIVLSVILCMLCLSGVPVYADSKSDIIIHTTTSSITVTNHSNTNHYVSIMLTCCTSGTGEYVSSSSNSTILLPEHSECVSIAVYSPMYVYDYCITVYNSAVSILF